MEGASRIPNLTAPFGALGALIGWVSASALQNPILRAGRDLSRPLAATGGFVTAALLGTYLTRRAHTQAQMAELGLGTQGAVRMFLALVLPLLGGGMVTGVLVGASVPKQADGIMLGAACGILAVPLCAIVLAAALRAERARLGSLVADTDRREVWAALLVAASLATAANLLDGPAWATIGLPGPWVAVAVAVLAVPLTLALHLRDRRARRSLLDHTKGLKDREREEAAAGELPMLDLGLGDEVRARYAQGSSAYRDHEREVALVRGDPAEARRALDWAERRGTAFLALVIVIVAAHAAALGPWFRLDYAAALCQGREIAGCVAEARLLDRQGVADPRVAELYARSCDLHHRGPCAELVQWFLSDPARARQKSALDALHGICGVGYGEACAVSADVARDAGDMKRSASFYEQACKHGHSPSCARR